jgi:hypothetical protein
MRTQNGPQLALECYPRMHYSDNASTAGSSGKMPLPRESGKEGNHAN